MPQKPHVFVKQVEKHSRLVGVQRDLRLYLYGFASSVVWELRGLFGFRSLLRAA